MRSVTYVCAIAACVALFTSLEDPARAELLQNGQVLKDVRENSVNVRVTAEGEDTSVVTVGTAEGARSVRLLDPFDAVQQLRVAPDRRAVTIVGDSRGGTRLVVIDAAVGKVAHSTFAFAPAVSPRGNLIVSEVFRSRVEPNQSAKYEVLALRGVATGGQVHRQRFFPTDDRNHSRQSDFFWVAPNTIAFLDLADDTSSLVVVQFREDGRTGRIVAKDLDTDQFVRRADVDSTSPAASAIYGPSITRIEGAGMLLRLTFPSSTALLVKRADVLVWN